MNVTTPCCLGNDTACNDDPGVNRRTDVAKGKGDLVWGTSPFVKGLVPQTRGDPGVQMVCVKLGSGHVTVALISGVVS